MDEMKRPGWRNNVNGRDGKTSSAVGNRIFNSFLTVDFNGVVLHADHASASLFGLSERDVLPEFWHKRLKNCIEQGGGEFVFEKDGRFYVFDMIPGAESVTFRGRDATGLIESGDELKLLDRVFENTREGVMITDSKGLIQRVNPAFTEITGYGPEDAVGKNPRLLSSGRHGPNFYKRMFESLGREGRWIGKVWNRRKNREPYLEKLTIEAVRLFRDGPVRYLAIFRDITNLKKENMIGKGHYYDALTGLPNRQLFFDRLERAIANAHRTESTLAVLSLDLDKFKDINDSMGHHVGDLFLVEAAKRLKKSCRNEDTVCRLGGDEFTLILPNIKQGGRDAVRVAERILTGFAEPFLLEGRSICGASSIGVTLYPDDGDDAEDLVKFAEMAMYRAKEQGGNRYEIYTEAINISVLRRIDMERNLRLALENNEFRIHYQPKVEIRSGMIKGTEALVRWQRSAKGLILPGEFIPVAEESGLIFPLGEWVLKTACLQTKKWHNKGYPLSVAVNISAKQFADKDLIGIVEKTLKQTNLPSEFLNLEITENVVMRDVDAAVEIMNSLKDMGVRLSVDDFGTGYSSLLYLKKFPLNVLKIDRSFVRCLPYKQDDVAITSAILSMARDLILEVVAEGVETVEQLEFMRQKGCGQIQGFLFSKPVAAKDMTRLLIEGKRLLSKKNK